jgi:hypothetical protein
LASITLVNSTVFANYAQNDGLVHSPDNSGLRDETPSHPELLDWLATWFIDNGWSLKQLHRLICTSAAYQRASASEISTADPENRLLAHFPKRRLTAEELRDAILAVSGGLDLTRGGSLMTVMNRTYANGGTAPANVREQLGYDSTRRSLYIPIIRTGLFDFFAAFDYPDPSMLTGQRSSTTVAPQALFLMNSPFVKLQAAAFALRVQSLGQDDAARVGAAYQLAFGREPTGDERAAAVAFLDHEAATFAADANPHQSAWTRLCHTLLVANEFLYVR